MTIKEVEARTGMTRENAHYVIYFAIEKRSDEFDQDFFLQNAQNCIILYKE